jgi:effector-binding domain-containing protein
VPASHGYDVAVQRVAPRALAAVRARLPMQRVPAVFASYLDQVYAAGKLGVVQLDGQNIFVYRSVAESPGDVDVEFGVGVRAPFASAGHVRMVQLPVGDVAMTTHRGPYSGLGGAHTAVIEWCRTRGLTLTGTRWEVYGHWVEDASKLQTDVYYLLESVIAPSSQRDEP